MFHWKKVESNYQESKCQLTRSFRVAVYNTAQSNATYTTIAKKAEHICTYYFKTIIYVCMLWSVYVGYYGANWQCFSWPKYCPIWNRYCTITWAVSLEWPYIICVIEDRYLSSIEFRRTTWRFCLNWRFSGLCMKFNQHCAISVTACAWDKHEYLTNVYAISIIIKSCKKQ